MIGLKCLFEYMVKKLPMENTKITKGTLINYTMILNNLKVGENLNILTSKF